MGRLYGNNIYALRSQEKNEDVFLRKNVPRERPERVLVAGGAGFLGSHLCEQLVARGSRVFCLDDLSTGRLRNIEHLSRSGRVEFIERSVATPFTARERKSLKIDRIFNLACPASPPDYQTDPVRTLRTSVWGMFNLLELAREHGAPILQASTSEVYGDPNVHPQPETYWGNVNPIGIRSCYDEGKRCAETLCFDHHRQHGTVVKVVRIFNTYGPRMRPNDGRVVSNFIVQALQGEDITVYGTGAQTRSFCYVDDLIDGFLRFMDAPSHITGPINLGNPGEFTVAELAEIVLRITGASSRIVYQPLPSDDPRQRRPDIRQAQALLGWQPTVALAEGLVRTIAYFDALLSETVRVPAAHAIAQEAAVL